MCGKLETKYIFLPCVVKNTLLQETKYLLSCVPNNTTVPNMKQIVAGCVWQTLSELSVACGIWQTLKRSVAYGISKTLSEVSHVLFGKH